MFNLFQHKDDPENSKKFREFVEAFIEKNKEEIINYFNSYEILSKPNDKNQNKDKAICKIYYPQENQNKYFIYIYNIPGLLRMNNGLFQIIGETMMIFQLFFDKYNKLKGNEYEQKFEHFLKAILDVDTNQIYNLIQLNIEENALKTKKLGLEHLMEMFGIENIKLYLKGIICTVGTFSILLTGGLYFANTITLATAIPIGVIIIIGISAFFLYKYFKYEKMLENMKKNTEKIHEFYCKVKEFLSKGVDFFCGEKETEKCDDKNLFVIAIEKEEKLIKEICLFSTYIKELNSLNCPTIGKDAPANSNSEYYCTILEACKNYTSYYSTKIQNHIQEEFGCTCGLQKEISNEFNFLYNANISQIKNRIKEIQPLSQIEEYKRKMDLAKKNQNLKNQEIEINKNINSTSEITPLSASPTKQSISHRQEKKVSLINEPLY